MKRSIQFFLLLAAMVGGLYLLAHLAQDSADSPGLESSPVLLSSDQPFELTPEEESWLQDHGRQIRYAPIPNAPPIDFVDGNKGHKGLTTDYFNLIQDRLKVTFTVVPYGTQKELMDALEQGEIDMVGSLQKNEERERFLNFTDSYCAVDTVILMQKDGFRSYKLDELQDRSIAVVDRSALSAHISRHFPNLDLVPVVDAKAGLTKLTEGTVDAMIADRAVASHYVFDRGFSSVRVAGNVEYNWNLHFASSTNYPVLCTLLNKALRSISAAERNAIHQKWIPLEDSTTIPRSTLMLIVAALLLLTLLAVGVVAFWSRVLRRKVTDELGQVRQSHQQTEQALGQSEERFRTLVESSSDMIWETDRLGNYTYVSPRVRDILGYEPNEVVGESAFKLQDQTDAARNMERARKATAETVLDCETNTHIHKGGRSVILETSGMAFADNTGQLAGFRGVSRDITERVEADAALKESEERFRNLVETTSDWIWEVDTRGVFTYVSPQVDGLLGYSAEELVGRRFTSTMPRPEAEAMETLFAEIAEQGAPIHSMVNINKHRAGRSVVFETSAVPFYDDAWKIMGYRGIGRDITDRMAIEKQLDFERNLFRSFMDHAPDLIYFKDREGHFIEVNNAKAHEVNLTPDELVGKTDFDFLPEEEAHQKYEDELEVMRTEKPMQKEEIASTESGRRWYLTTKVPRYDEKGKVVGTFGTSWDITYRKQAAEELRQLRAQLSNIIDSMPSILVGVGVNGCVTQWNREAENLTQITAADAAGKPLKSVFPRLAKEMVKVERAIRERATQKEQRIPVREASRTRYNDVTVYPLLDNDAEGAVIRVDDVTDRVLMEDSIRNIVEGVSSVGRQFFRSMVNQLAKSLDADFAFISEYADEDRTTMRTIAVVENGESVGNYDYALNGTPCERVLHGDICIFTSDVRKQFPTTQLLQEKEIESYIGIALVDSEGTPLGIMAAMYRDPVEQVEFATSVMQVFAGRTAAELERLQATKELLQLRNLLSNIINSMPSTLVGVDAESRVMQWNREAERMTGVAAEQAQGKLLEEVFPDLGNEMGRVLEAIGNRELQHDGHIPFVRDGEQRFADVTVYPLTTEGSDGAVIRVDDITDRVRIEEMMVQSEKMMSVGGLAAGMAHEINNPLAGILQNLQVMRNRIVHSTDRNVSAASDAGTSLEAIQTYMHERGLLKMMDSVTEAGRRAAKIVDNMLSFSRKDEAHYAPNNLEELLERSVELASNDYNLKKRFDFRHIRIERDYDQAIDLIPCEGSQIQQVILNLLTNSAQAMAGEEAGTKEPCITLRLKCETSSVLIEVEDNGPGMDAETRKRAFEPFFTTKEVGHGTGLGLSVSYFIITENHGGTMLVRSDPGKGSCFSIRIPFEHRQTMWGLRL